MQKIDIPKNTKEAILIQKNLAKKLILKDSFTKLQTIAAVDLHYKEEFVVLGYVVVSYPANSILEKVIKKFPITVNFSYKPGFLCFLEGPYIVEFLSEIQKKPDVLILDGHGIAHPRKMGLASYVGVVCDIATVGCAKKLLYGSYDRKKLSSSRGSFAEIKDKQGKVIAVALRTKDNTKEVFVSTGHKISLNTAKEVVLKLSKHRIPEPLRLAHSLAKSGYEPQNTKNLKIFPTT